MSDCFKSWNSYRIGWRCEFALPSVALRSVLLKSVTGDQLPTQSLISVHDASALLLALGIFNSTELFPSMYSSDPEEAHISSLPHDPSYLLFQRVAALQTVWASMVLTLILDQAYSSSSPPFVSTRSQTPTSSFKRPTFWHALQVISFAGQFAICSKLEFEASQL